MKTIAHGLSAMFFSWAFMLGFSACAQSPDPLISIAQENHAVWNGVTVSKDGHIFVNYPGVTSRPHPSVAEFGRDGRFHPFPSAKWNDWTPGKPVDKAFVGTNAIRIGPDGDLWVVDTGSPDFGAETLPNAAKVVRIDLQHHQVRKIYPLGDGVVGRKSYVDDIRFHGRLAYLTDAGVPGIIVLDLTTGKARRVLDHDKSTTGAKPIVVDGFTLHSADGRPVILNADQMEVSPDGKWFYFQPLSGPLYRIETSLLDDPSIAPAILSQHVQFWYETGALGGTAIDSDGNLYLEVLGNDSIVKLTPDRKASTIIEDHRLHWSDAPWLQDGWLYLPVAQIDRAPQFRGGASAIEWPLHIYKLYLSSLR
ncbi:L-dopachrome tautomerase-related protein [Silvibacterium sp.]|uniref:L-dopachrome tautomerase-related protein n=1 Tax=Silvibacterium sp. TaxID=1964179 RepID=UPI0039E33AFA